MQRLQGLALLFALLLSCSNNPNPSSGPKQSTAPVFVSSDEIPECPLKCALVMQESNWCGNGPASITMVMRNSSAKGSQECPLSRKAAFCLLRNRACVYKCVIDLASSAHLNISPAKDIILTLSPGEVVAFRVNLAQASWQTCDLWQHVEVNPLASKARGAYTLYVAYEVNYIGHLIGVSFPDTVVTIQ